MLTCNLRYLKHSLKPTLLMLPPLIVLMIHLDSWFGYTPLRPGQAALVRAKLLGSAQPSLDEVALEAGAGLAIETPSLRIPQEREISWVVRAGQAGQYSLSMKGAGGTAQKRVVVADNGWQRVAPRLVTAEFWHQWAYPGEASLPRDGPFEWVEVRLPRAIFGALWTGDSLAGTFLRIDMCVGFRRQQAAASDCMMAWFPSSIGSAPVIPSGWIPAPLYPPVTFFRGNDEYRDAIVQLPHE